MALKRFTKEEILALIQKSQAKPALKTVAAAVVKEADVAEVQVPAHMTGEGFEHVVDALAAEPTPAKPIAAKPIAASASLPALKPMLAAKPGLGNSSNSSNSPSSPAPKLMPKLATITAAVKQAAPHWSEWWEDHPINMDAFPLEAPVLPPAVIGITYTDEQQAAIDAAGAGKSFVMCGFAGTGKTTAAKGCVLAMMDSGRVKNLGVATKWLAVGSPGAAIVSFTNKAVQNIKRQMPASLQNNTLTIHKLLQYEPHFYEVEDTATGTYKKIMRFEPRYNADNPLPRQLGIIVHEESSMEGVDLYANLCAALPHKPQEIFLGDLNQLPPVFGSAILGFKMNKLPVIELTKPQRQAAQSSILRFSWAIKNGEWQQFRGDDFRTVEVDHPTKKGQTVTRKVWNWATRLASENDENGRITIKPFQKKLLESHATLTVVTMLKQWSLPSCTDALVRYNPDEDIILTPYNKAFGTIELNKQIAQFLGERRGALVHEVIAGFQKYYLAIGDKMFYNKEECIITDLVRNDEYMGKIPQPASRNLDRWGNFKEVATEEGYHETAADSDDFDLLNTLSAENIEDRVNAASHVAVLKFGDGTELEISSAAAFNNMLGGYALTVHKSQGSEWRKTYIFLHHTQATMHSRELLYTAVTRTKQELVVICEGDSIEKCVRNARLEGTTLAEKMKLFQGDKLTEYERTMLEKGVLL